MFLFLLGQIREFPQAFSCLLDPQIFIFSWLSVPPVATISIAGAILALFILCCCCCCCRFCCRRKKVDDDKESDGGDGEETISLESVELVKMPQHERLEPGVDEMDYSVAGFYEEEEFSGTVLGKISKSPLEQWKLMTI